MAEASVCRLFQKLSKGRRSGRKYSPASVIVYWRPLLSENSRSELIGIEMPRPPSRARAESSLGASGTTTR
jgi:hypothetical protein